MEFFITLATNPKYSTEIIADCESLWAMYCEAEKGSLQREELLKKFIYHFKSVDCSDWVLSGFDETDLLSVENNKKAYIHDWYQLIDKYYTPLYSDQFYNKIQLLHDNINFSHQLGIWLNNCTHCSDNTFSHLKKKYWDNLTEIMMILSDPRFSEKELTSIIDTYAKKSPPWDYVAFIQVLLENPNVSVKLLKKILYEHQLDFPGRKYKMLEKIINHHEFSFTWLLQELDQNFYAREPNIYSKIGTDGLYKDGLLTLVNKAKTFSDFQRMLILEKIPYIAKLGLSYDHLNASIDLLEVI